MATRSTVGRPRYRQLVRENKARKLFFRIRFLSRRSRASLPSYSFARLNRYEFIAVGFDRFVALRAEEVLISLNLPRPPPPPCCAVACVSIRDVRSSLSCGERSFRFNVILLGKLGFTVDLCGRLRSVQFPAIRHYASRKRQTSRAPHICALSVS